MPKTYVNTGFVPGASDYVDTSDTVYSTTVGFTAKSTVVKVATAAQRMVSESLTIVAPFGVKACEENSCDVGQLNASAKIHLNFPYGDTQSLGNLVTELNRLLAVWQANNMAFGVVPPLTTNIDEA